MLDDAFRKFSENLWQDWLADRIVLPKAVTSRFLMSHAPEPYLRFGDGTKPLCLLFTNPGRGMPHQRRSQVLAGQSCLSAALTYYDNAARLAAFYTAQLPSGGASTRNKAIDSIRQLLRYDHVLQFETLPFHSDSLPQKQLLPKLVSRAPLLAEYADHLAKALSQQSVITLSAVATNRPISKHSISASPWLSWQAFLMGIDIDRIELHPLVTKGTRVTTALLCQHETTRSAAFVLTMGSNSFPALQGRERLASAFYLTH